MALRIRFERSCKATKRFKSSNLFSSSSSLRTPDILHDDISCFPHGSRRPLIHAAHRQRLLATSSQQPHYSHNQRTSDPATHPRNPIYLPSRSCRPSPAFSHPGDMGQADIRSPRRRQQIQRRHLRHLQHAPYPSPRNGATNLASAGLDLSHCTGLSSQATGDELRLGGVDI